MVTHDCIEVLRQKLKAVQDEKRRIAQKYGHDKPLDFKCLLGHQMLTGRSLFKEVSPMQSEGFGLIECTKCKQKLQKSFEKVYGCGICNKDKDYLCLLCAHIESEAVKEEQMTTVHEHKFKAHFSTEGMKECVQSPFDDCLSMIPKISPNKTLSTQEIYRFKCT